MWGVPADHEIFKSLNTAQWLWYFYNYIEDKQEEYKLHRNMAEYNAAFSNPKAVKEAITKREEDEVNRQNQSREKFDKSVEKMFGREMNSTSAEKPEEVVKNLDFFSKLTKDMQTQSHLQNDKGKNYKHWSDLKLE